MSGPVSNVRHSPIGNTMTTNNNNEIKALEDVRNIVRPEINIEKHADFIFAPSHSKTLGRPRKKMWTIELKNGEKAAAYLLIQPIYGGKTFTTKTRKVYLALTQLWEQRRRDDDTILFSAREIANMLGIKWAGKRVAKEIYREIEALRSCLFTWQYSFIDPHGEKINLLDHINILDKFSYVTRELRKQNAQKFQALHLIRFSEPIRANLKSNKTKPTYFDIVLSIKGEIASVLYARLDIILSSNEFYERTSKGLFDDLHLESEKGYQYASQRKQKLEKAIKELAGKEISTGMLSLKLEKTVDGTDWKLVARRVVPLPSPKKSHSLSPANPTEMIPLLVEDIGAVIGNVQQKRRLYEMFAVHYPASLIHRALSEYKADVKDPKNGGRVFTSILHRLVHESGKDWIRPCGDDCKHQKSR
jgi:hypothetical protein